VSIKTTKHAIDLKRGNFGTGAGTNEETTRKGRKLRESQKDSKGGPAKSP